MVADIAKTAVSILFVGYILMQVPSNLFLNKIGKPAIYLPASVGKPQADAQNHTDHTTDGGLGCHFHGYRGLPDSRRPVRGTLLPRFR